VWLQKNYVVAAGVPGTGKTATVKQVMRYMLENKEDFPEFTFHEINGMRLTCPEQVGSFTVHTLHVGEQGGLS
jgi:Cdc6-like AAA superfamily ATPase